MKKLILLIDDNEQFIADVKFFMQKEYDILATPNSDAGLSHVRMQNPEVVLLDVRLGNGESGLDVLRKIKRIDPDLPVIILTQFPDVEDAVTAIKLGAMDYKSKVANLVALKAIIEQQMQFVPWRRLYREEQKQRYGPMIGESLAMKKILEDIRNFADTDIPVLITGESGTGKELAAYMLHEKSQRCAQIYQSVNCSTLERHLFESEFFGHVRGAFTGAIRDKKGIFELANHGTLFLDEVADLPIESQAKLLKAIEYGEYQRVGGAATQQADVRIIAATNKNLQEEIKKGNFREDLYYRLNVLELIIPPLRERTEDIPDLARHFLDLACRERKRPPLKIPPQVMQYWVDYHWPNNIRELHNEMTRAVFQCKGETVNSSILRGVRKPDGQSNFYRKLLTLPYNKAKAKLLQQFQMDYVQQALARNNHNISQTAAEIGINRSTIHRVKKLLYMTGPQQKIKD